MIHSLKNIAIKNTKKGTLGWGGEWGNQAQVLGGGGQLCLCPEHDSFSQGLQAVRQLPQGVPAPHGEIHQKK